MYSDIKREEKLWSNFLSSTAVVLSMLLPIIALAKPLNIADCNLTQTKLKTKHMEIMDMRKVEPKTPLIFNVSCSQVLKNMDGYICYSYSDKSPRFNIYAINERVNKINLKKRLNFKADKRIPREYRNPIKCFKHNDYDLGHLEPDADVDFNKSAMYHTYLMSNIVPQPSYINRYVISKWEAFERALTFTGTVVMITGADYYKSKYFNNKNCSKLPKDYYKVYFVYDNIIKRFEPFLLIYTKNNTTHKVYSTHRKSYIINFLKKRKIYFLNKK